MSVSSQQLPVKEEQNLLQQQEHDNKLQDHEIYEEVVIIDPDETSSLIELVKQCPCIWEVGGGEYKDIQKKAQCWIEVAKILQCPVEAAKAAWEKLRANYRKCLQRRHQRLSSGVSRRALPSCGFFEELSFLESTVELRRSTLNITPIQRQPPTEGFQQETLTEGLQRQTSSTASPTSPVQKSTSVNQTPSQVQSYGPTNGKRTKSNCIETPPNDTFHANSLVEKRAEVQVAACHLPDLADQDVLYCLSLVKDFKQLSKRKKLEMKIKIAHHFLESLDEDSE